MFNWLKRKIQIASAKAATEDIDRFILYLRGLDSDDIGLLVGVAAHCRNTMFGDGSALLDPVRAERSDPAIGLTINRMIVANQRDGNPIYAAGLMVWLHTIRAANTPEVRLKGRQMWGQLCRGFSFVEDAATDLKFASGVELRLEEYSAIPKGLEPDVR